MTFSKNYGYGITPGPIVIREGAPREMREALLQITYHLDGHWDRVLKVACGVLRKMQEGHWNEPFLRDEVSGLVMNCPWFRVYDITEALHASFTGSDESGEKAEAFQTQLNEVFEEQGIGWKMEGGKIQVRGDTAFERAVQTAREALIGDDRATAEQELRLALEDLSRRPAPDITGAIQHSNAALECLLREFCGDTNSTMGDLLKHHKTRLAIPRPLDSALEKAWGFASEHGRHLVEGRNPRHAEAELVVHIAAAIITYLSTCTQA